MRKFLAACATGLLCSLAVAGPASAHAALVGSDPRDGATLQALPSRVAFDFNENVGRAAIAVTAPDGSQVRVGGVEAVDRTASATLTDPGMRGRYSASYRVVSADGHPVQGTVVFTVTTGRTVEQTNEQTSSADDGFIETHLDHLLWGGAAGLAAVALIVVPLRRRDDTRDA